MCACVGRGQVVRQREKGRGGGRGVCGGEGGLTLMQ